MTTYADAQLDAYLVEAQAHRRVSRDLLRAMTQGWARPSTDAEEWEGAVPRRLRRDRLAQDLAGEVLVIPNGIAKVRSNDLFFPFRPGTDHMWLVGPTDPGSVLVLEADGTAVLYLDERPPLGHPLALLDSARGAIWGGVPEPLAATTTRLGVHTRTIEDLPKALAGKPARTVRGLDPRTDALTRDDDRELEKHLARMRLVKDSHEIAQLRDAADAAVQGFEAVGRSLAEVLKQGEAFAEALFAQQARIRGRGVAYPPIAGGGANATVLHWFTNDGQIGSDDLLLLDAGVEGPELYSSDVTRTIPVSGRYTSVQRDVYDVVHAAQRAALDAVRPGAPYAEPGERAIEVLVIGLRDLGVLPHPAMAQLPDEQAVRRWSLHGIGHMLGADVHDAGVVAHEYLQEPLAPGHVLTIEPGLYFSPYDEWAPAHLRGIGVRIEDDIVVTEDGIDILTDALPTSSAGVEAWLGEQQ